ncbi:hypothetical protein CGLO_02066 [Colletotrichum gloeosporioides Cg-14]|uniref:Uncharacterized protein n=1 Tax=Colletotrichum gloeosporioides (strain Cg-14) TaxID=1237896 RepID=T0KPJ9_COLGC|nr:hypothetical protein CGLO_02066 [Colletotrichum gloeosporioides Cg-14]
MQLSFFAVLAAVSLAMAAPNPVPQASCSLAKVNECIKQCGTRQYDCFDNTCYCA